MSHPLNRRERFEIGARKGHQRARFYMSYVEWKTDPELIEIRARQLRNDAKPCSCQMCRNPRRSVFYKGKGKLTMQERRFNCGVEQSGSSLGS